MEENKCGNEAASQRQGIVVEDSSEDCEAAVLVHRRLVRPDGLRRQGEAGYPARFHAPAEECPGRASGGELLGVPGVEVGLLALFGSAASVGEPDEEGIGLGDHSASAPG
ncbi:hypothetical protein ABZT28_53570 [Streptomyces sp. NPDC005388]|uniref:hypothetical protein n=1 Tax=Streptomyces sp. NPDC005388 TaxID=3156717 RepID=UPI0033B18216